MAGFVDIDLGAVQEVRTLFSYPPNCHEVCFLDQTIEQTVATYVNSSIARDGFGASRAAARIENDRLLVRVEGEAAEPYRAILGPYLSAGRLALDASRRLHRDKKWRYNWRFFLPHGVAMTRHRTVQLLHFPPDYVLARDQDYLSANTTKRWASLLEENGVTPGDTARFQNIVDIAPIAAPSSDGRNLDGVYGDYEQYILALLRLWLPVGDGTVRPMVAFGGPVRGWLKARYGTDLKVLGLAKLPVLGRGEPEVPTLAANHPSFIYNAADRLDDDPNTPEDERLALLMRVMQEDLVAANWQAEVGANAAADPQAVLDACRRRWSRPDRRTRLCELAYQQALDKSPEQARALCANLPPLAADIAAMTASPKAAALEERLEKLRAEIGALDGREPEDIR